MEIKEMKGIIEAVLFAFGDCVEAERIASALGCPEDKVREAIKEMADACEAEDRGVRIVELGGSFTMCTKKEAYKYLKKIAAQPKKYLLTDVLLETLSIIAHRQPVTRLEIEKIRGVNSNHAVNRLVEYGLVEEVGRMNAPGKPLLFGTTEEFFKRFGIRSMDELPLPDAEETKPV